MEISHVEIGGKYNDCIILDEYNGEISLCNGNIKDDKVYMRWCYPQGRDREPGKKSIPWKIKIGENKEQARQTLKALFAQLDDNSDWVEGSVDDGQEPTDEQIPF